MNPYSNHELDSTPVSPTRTPPISANQHQISSTVDVDDHRVNFIRRWRRRHIRTIIQTATEGWQLPNNPYHEYVRELVAAGWTNLKDLDEYLGGKGGSSYAQDGIVISVLDMSHHGLKHWPEMHNELDLKHFMEHNKNHGHGNVRLYLVESHGCPSAAFMEVVGSELKLDPRFFRLSIRNQGHVFTPSQRHRAPYLGIEFGVLDATTLRKTDAEKFKVLIYILPDSAGIGWTGVILFNSITKINLSPRILTNPPPYESPIPPRTRSEPKSFRNLYIESLSFIDIQAAIYSPFYAVSNLFRLNCFCWNQIITAIRDEDKRINGISDTTIGHIEEIKKTLSIVRRGGSLCWPGREETVTKENMDAIREDFEHLVEQTDLLWQTREKMEAIRQRNSDTRWTSLTNAFTYIFAPVTIMSGIFGMNVSQISGSSINPNIWQFFVAIAVLNVVIVAALSISIWMEIQWKHGRKAGLREVLGYSVGKVELN